MNALLTLYRFLARNQDRTSDHHEYDRQYNVALQTLEPVLSLLEDYEYYARTISEEGGITWEQANEITEKTIEAHQVALCQHAGSNVKALANFAEWCIGLDEIATLIDALQQQKATMEHEQRKLAELDDHPF